MTSIKRDGIEGALPAPAATLLSMGAAVRLAAALAAAALAWALVFWAL